MNKKHIEQEEYNLSPNEFHMQKDDYDLDMKEFNMVSENFSQQEFGSQPQSEFNEYQEQIKSKPKKSKFKKMMQYLVAGVAGAAIIVSTAGLTISEKDDIDIPPIVQDDDIKDNTNISDEVIIENDKAEEVMQYIIYDVPYETYEYTLDANSKYRIIFDENKMDDVYSLYAQMIYNVTSSFDDINDYFDFIDSYGCIKVKTPLGGAGIVASEISVYEFDNAQKFQIGNAQHFEIGNAGTYTGGIIRWGEDSVEGKIRTIFEKYNGLSKKEIYNKLINEYSREDFYIDFDDFYHKEGEGNIQCKNLETEESEVIILPTFCKVERVYEDE